MKSVSFQILIDHFIAQKLKSLNQKDPNSFGQLLTIARYVQNNHIDARKFNTLKAGVAKFVDSKGKQMSLEEMIDYCRTLFSDRKFIDILAKFSIDDPKSVEEK